MPYPQVTVIFLAYNQEDFVSEALLSALNQDLSHYELVIADDASSDGTWAKILSTLDSNPRVGVGIKLLRQPRNRGIIGNFNDAVALATGDILVAMAGDDISEPARARLMADAFASDPEIKAVTCQSRKIDAQGRCLGKGCDLDSSQSFSFRKSLRRGPFAGGVVTGACAAYHRSLFDVFGPLAADAGGEDIDYMFRALISGKALYISKPLVRYRQHHGNVCNFGATSLRNEELEEREIRMTRLMGNADRQWMRDLDLARQLGMISGHEHASIARVVAKFVLRHRLTAISLGVEPLARWWVAAVPLMRLGDFIKVAKLLWLRLSRRRRENHWKWVRTRRK